MKYFGIVIFAIAMLMSLDTTAQGCMEAGDEDGVKVVGFIQPQAQYSFLGNDLAGESLDESSFYFNRARLGVVGNIPYDFNYYLMTEMSPEFDGAPFILDAFITYNRFAPYLKATIGQFKSPFGLELLTPCHKLHTINRAEVVNNLAAPFYGRDFGIMVHGGTGELSILGSKTENFLGYHLAVMNGNGVNIRDNNNKKDIIGRLTIHPVEFVTIGASYRFGEHPPLSESAVEDDRRTRFGLDLELKYDNFLVQGEFITGTDRGSTLKGGGCGDETTIVEGTTRKRGYFLQAMYMTKWNIQPVIRYETFDPNLDMASGDIGIGYDDAIHNVITYGVNYFFNEWTRLQVNYLYRAEEDGNVEINNDAVLVQFQVAF